MSSHVTTLTCAVCGRRYEPGPDRYVCDVCGPVGTLDVGYDLAAVAGELDPERLGTTVDPTMWRYGPLLPAARGPVGLRVGGTPLYRVDGLAADLGIATLWIKDEALEPTASMKDRASAMVVAKALEFGRPVVATASTGNAAAALAGVAAATPDVDAVIFVPAAAPEAKIAQLLAFGATVVLVDGSYDDAYELCATIAARRGWYNRNTGFNPYTTEGKKTVALEIAEGLSWEPPDAVVVPVGDGSIIGGVHKGFVDAHELGWIERIPRLFGIQSTGSSYLADAFDHNEDVTRKPPIEPHTIADSISAGLPRDRVKAMRAVRDTGGAFLAVDDAAILAAIPRVAATTGVFPEPAAAAAFAGLEAAIGRGLLGTGDRVVAISTGSGLKDIPATMEATRRAGIVPFHVAPDPDEFDAVYDHDRGAR